MFFNIKTYMKITKNDFSLLKLLHDQDEIVFTHISENIKTKGIGFIPNLESILEQTNNPIIQNRINNLISTLNFNFVKTQLIKWKKSATQNLMTGVYLIDRIAMPDLNYSHLKMELKNMKKTIWLELSVNLSPLEKANILIKILKEYFKIQIIEFKNSKSIDFSCFNLIQSKQGNSYAVSIFFLFMFNEFNINAKLINFLNYNIIVFKKYKSIKYKNNKENHLFYLNSFDLELINTSTLENYCKSNNIYIMKEFYNEKSNLQIIMDLVSGILYRSQEANNLMEVQKYKQLLQILKS